MPIIQSSLISVSSIDDVLKRYGNQLGGLSDKQMNRLLLRTLNAEGDKMRNQVRRALVKQTGLKRAVIVRAVRRRGASPGDLSYTLTTRGGNIRLKFFGAKEFRYGVRAKPRNVSTTYKGAFIKGGQFPNRKGLKFGGEVKERVGKGRLPLRTVRSNVYIPEEMVTGDSAKAFYSTSSSLARQLDRQLRSILAGF